MTKNCKNLQLENKFGIFLSKIAIHLSKASLQATGEAFSPQKRTSSTSKHEIFFLFLWVVFAFLDPDPLT
jgi:hypothetical protein